MRERPTEHLPETGADSGELGTLDRSLLWPLVCALPERQRAVIVLRYYEDMSEAQIAQTMVHLGVELNVVSKASLADAFALALQRTGRTVVRSRLPTAPAARV